MLPIAPERSISFLYRVYPSTGERNIFAQLMFLQDVARLVTEAEMKQGVVMDHQQTQRLTLEFLLHLVGSRIVPIAGPELRRRMHLHMSTLSGRLKCIGQRFQTHGDLAYLRDIQLMNPTSHANTNDDGTEPAEITYPLYNSLLRQSLNRGPDRPQPLTLKNIASGMSIFHYIDGLQGLEEVAEQSLTSAPLVSRLWSDIIKAYEPILPSSPHSTELLHDSPVDMESLFSRYFEMAKQPEIVAELTNLLKSSQE